MTKASSLAILLLAISPLAACSSSATSGNGSDAGTAGADGAKDYGQWCDSVAGIDSECDCLGGASPIESPLAACPPANLTHAVCCADLGYPESDSSYCTCKSWGCRETSTSCDCSKGENGDVALPAACAGTYDHCCALNNLSDETISCRCGSTTCTSMESEVASCGLSQARCGSKLAVTACR